MIVAKAYRLINTLSIDVVLGAVCCALFFARLLQVSLLLYGIVSLALTVWIIYTADHLLDAKRVEGIATTRRHHFHQQYFSLLSICLLLAMVSNIVLLFFIRERVLLGGLFLICGVSIYLLLHTYLKVPKEVLISILYTCGVLLPSLMVTPVIWHELPYVLIAQFALSALINLLVFSWFDYERDRQDGFKSMATMWGRTNTARLIYVAAFINTALFFISEDRSASGVPVAVAVLHLLILYRADFFGKDDRFRLLGDASFMLPLFYLLW